MANEILMSASLTVTLGGASVGAQKSKYLDMVGTEVVQSIISVDSAAAADIPITPCNEIGQIMVENLDTTVTHFVEIALVGNASFGAAPKIKIMGGAMALFATPAATISWKADTTDCAVRLTVVEL
jgi:hypothetical protein